MLEHPKPHETESIPAEFLGVNFYSEKLYGTATYQDVENYNTMAAGASTPHTDSMYGTAPPLLADDDNDDIKEVDIPEMSLRK